MNDLHRHRHGVTLIELVLALGVTAILMLGLSAALLLAGRTATIMNTPSGGAVHTGGVLAEMTRDLTASGTVVERSDTAITISVPDRDGDGSPDQITYAWLNAVGNPGGPGDPLTRSFNAGVAIPIIEGVDDFDLTYYSRDVEGTFIDVAALMETWNVLLVVPDPDDLDADEQARKTLIESWGYVVTTIEDSEPQSAFDLVLDDHDVVYICETANGDTLDERLLNATIGVVNEEQEQTEELLVEETATKDYDGTTIKILNGTHYITSTHGPGDLQISTSSVKLLRNDGDIAPGGVVLASKEDDTNRAVMVIAEPGATLWESQTATGRRVVLPWGKDLDFSKINADGLTLMKRAIDWAAGNEQGGGSVLGYDTIYDTPVNNVRRLQIATQVTMPESGTVSQIVAFTGGAASGGTDCRFAIYTDAAGEPDALVVESANFATDETYAWQGAPVADTPLVAGTYWLALSFESNDSRYFHQSGGQVRYLDHWATSSGFLASWGASSDSYSIAMSIYAVYTPDGGS